MALLLFLGRLEDLAGAAEMHLPLSAPETLTAIVARLPPGLSAAIADPRIRLAINGVLCPDREQLIAPADEVAFLPPVSGG